MEEKKIPVTLSKDQINRIMKALQLLDIYEAEAEKAKADTTLTFILDGQLDTL
jgi:hypothetical protein